MRDNIEPKGEYLGSIKQIEDELNDSCEKQYQILLGLIDEKSALYYEPHIDSFNLSVPKIFKSELEKIFKHHSADFKRQRVQKRIFYIYDINGFEFETFITSKNIIVTFKGITSYRVSDRSSIYTLIKTIGFQIPLTHVQRLDICYDFAFNDTYPKHLSSQEISIHSNMMQPFNFKKFQLLKMAPADELEMFCPYLCNRKYFTIPETKGFNTKELYCKFKKRWNKDKKNFYTQGLGKRYFRAYYYDKYIKSHESKKLFPKGVVRLEYSFRVEVLEKLKIHTIQDIRKVMPPVIDRLNKVLVIMYKDYSDELRVYIEPITKDREFIKLLSYFWKKKNELPSTISAFDDDNMKKLAILKDIKDGLTNRAICEKYEFANEKPITKLRLLKLPNL